MKKLGTLLLACVLSLSLVGCGNSETNQGEGTKANVSGKVVLEGSTSMEKLMNALKEAIREDYPELSLEPQFTGSGSGIKAVASGKVDIGNSSRALTDEEKAQGIEENVVALDGIAMITEKSNTVKNLTKQQLADIYTGKIKNWKEVGGADQKIVVVGREAASGTRGAFEEILDIKDKCQYANELNETGAVVAKVQETKGAIGYVSLDIVEDSKDKVNTLQLDGITASESTILDGSYQLQRPFVMATKGKIEEQSEQVQAVFNFINSEKGQAVIKQVKLIIPQK
ncbi:phosphate ABC transporter substrate-binding protein [Longibaculum muris]|uniref:phosphate ABC transporter substrate-binding protein n=1 Tax=Longibaculum muris TaxID=1796628 RepID=UPI00189C93EC|nr:phosphate ABC transporter substrate-binding protein [Longibaculum muris]